MNKIGGWFGFLFTSGMSITIIIYAAINIATEDSNDFGIIPSIVLITFGLGVLAINVWIWLLPEIKSYRCPECKRFFTRETVSKESSSVTEAKFIYECKACHSKWHHRILIDLNDD